MKSDILNSKNTDTVVYDISLDGTFIDALTLLCCHNTDGFDFKMPEDISERALTDIARRVRHTQRQRLTSLNSMTCILTNPITVRQTT